MKALTIFRITSSLLLSGSALFLSLSFNSQPAQAATVQVSQTSPIGKVTLTFDDGFRSAYTNVAPILKQYGLTGTEYVISDCAANLKSVCEENDAGGYLTWQQIQALQDTYGWEIGSHSVTAPLLTTVTPTQLQQEVANSQKQISEQAILSPTSFATPYGDYNSSVIAEIAKYYKAQRPFADQNLNSFPYNDYMLDDEQVQEGVTVAQVETWIEQAITNKQWLILTFHDVVPTPSTDPTDYQYSTAELTQIAQYLQAHKTPVVNISNGIAASTTNLLTNSTFQNGITQGWTTDAPTNITHDTGNNGSYPDPTDSIKLTSTTKNVHLFSPKVSVTHGQTYVLKNFLNVTANNGTGGQIAFYIDEYNASGTWISGQLKTGEKSVYAEDLNFTYTPSSSNVAFASLQVIVTANSGITAYFDNSQWFPEGAPSPAINTTYPAVSTNLISNGNFDDGLGVGWSTDSTTIIADTGGNGGGTTPATSIKLQSSTTNTHLFSPIVSISTGKTYTISSYLNLKQISSGVVGYYRDVKTKCQIL